MSFRSGYAAIPYPSWHMNAFSHQPKLLYLSLTIFASFIFYVLHNRRGFFRLRSDSKILGKPPTCAMIGAFEPGSKYYLVNQSLRKAFAPTPFQAKSKRSINLPCQTQKRRLRRFLGKVNFYRRIITAKRRYFY